MNSRAEYQKKWYQENKERVLARQVDARTYADRRDYMQTEQSRRQRKNWKLEQQFGITVADYDQLLAEQGGVCAICGKEPKKLDLSVDHCHETGTIRGLLCMKCNTSLGWFGDDVESLLKVIQYLEGES